MDATVVNLPTFLGLPLIAWIPLLPLIGAFFNLVFGRRFSQGTAHGIAILAVVGAFVVSVVVIAIGLFHKIPVGQGEVYAWKVGGVESSVFTWIEVGALKINLAFRVDSLSAVMITIVTFIGALIHVYSTGYMHNEKPASYARYFGYLNLFTGSMLILVLAANMPVMFIGWEGVGLCSFLLIGYWFERDDYAYAGRKAFVVNRIGDFAFLLGMFLLYWAVKGVPSGDLVAAATAHVDHTVPGAGSGLSAQIAQVVNARGSLDFANLNNPALGPIYVSPFWGSERLAAAAGILLFIGACGKSAQFPLYVWLPDAMAGPTPVSALIHAATMVTAGVYMVVRMSFLYASSTTAMIVVATVGLLTALLAAFMAFAQTDMKKVLAYSTVSQLGFMFVAAGTGNWVAAIFHLGTHAFFKACLFLGAGSVMHAMEHGGAAHGSPDAGDLRLMGGLRKHLPITHITFLISCLAIAGIFPFSGFWSKDEILAGAWSVLPPGWPAWYGKVLWGGLLVAALGTAFYMWRLYFLAFGGRERSEFAKHAHESPPSMTVPLVILAVGATVAGILAFPHWHHAPLGIEALNSKWVHALPNFLDPVVAHSFYMPGVEGEAYAIHQGASDGTTTALMLGALAIGGLGILAAWALYSRGPSPRVQKLVDGPLAGAYEASKHKLWVDEIYDRVIVRPFKTVARGLYEIVDRFIIDTVAVNGSAFVIGLFGRLSRWLQNGQVQRYLAGVIVGAAAVFLITDCHRSTSFSYRYTNNGNTLELKAEAGAGMIGSSTKLHWHLDGNEDCNRDKDRPSDPPELSVPSGDVIGGVVVLCVVDPITGKTKAISETLREAN